MNLLTITIISMGISILMDKLFILKVYKTLGDLGYKANIREIDDIAKYMCNFTLIGSVIPFFNVFSRMFVYLKLYMTQNQMIQALREYEVIRPMTEKELERYKENPTATTAIKILKDNIIEKGKVQTIYIVINGEENSISYQIIDDKMEIVDIKGPITKQRKTKKELEQIIYDSWVSLLATGIRLETNTFEQTLKENNYLSVKYENNKDGVEEIKYDYDYDELSKMYEYFEDKDMETDVIGKSKKLMLK